MPAGWSTCAASSTTRRRPAAGAAHRRGSRRGPYLGSLGYASPDGPGPRRHNSAQRLGSLWHAFTVPDDLQEALSRLAGPLLLIDDRIETGWTMTIAAKQLREAGAPAVLPLAFAVTTG
jgi:ATP-dependent DNA helicase RecQ